MIKKAMHLLTHRKCRECGESFHLRRIGKYHPGGLWFPGHPHPTYRYCRACFDSIKQAERAAPFPPAYRIYPDEPLLPDFLRALFILPAFRRRKSRN